MRKWVELPQELQLEEIRLYHEYLYSKRCQLYFKRITDIILAGFMLIVLFPFFVLLGIIIKLDSPGPIFFRQQRVTQYGRVFRIHKFRTMCNDAERKGTQVTVGNDARITRVGKLIRSCRLDETAQLIDILKGDMTFVGTRPEVIKYVEAYKPEWKATLLLPAGVTSSASIYYKDEDRLLEDCENVDKTYICEILPQKMRYNLDELCHFSIWNDLLIMINTLRIVFF